MNAASVEDVLLGTEITLLREPEGEPWTPGKASMLRAQLFGLLVRLSEGTLRDYHCDLFHDAEWLSEYVSGPTTFDWAVRESGTSIALAGSSPAVLRLSPGSIAFKVRLSEDKGRWYAVVTKL